MIPDPVASWNERMKIMAGFVNAIGLGLIGFAVLRPLAEEITRVSLSALWWWIAGLSLHAVSHYILGHLRKASP